MTEGKTVLGCLYYLVAIVFMGLGINFLGEYDSGFGFFICMIIGSTLCFFWFRTLIITDISKVTIF